MKCTLIIPLKNITKELFERCFFLLLLLIIILLNFAAVDPKKTQVSNHFWN